MGHLARAPIILLIGAGGAGKTRLANCCVTSGANYEDGDLDGDGDVDLSDLSALLAVYGTLCE